jgi:hypothetical protein
MTKIWALIIALTFGCGWAWFSWLTVAPTLYSMVKDDDVYFSVAVIIYWIMSFAAANVYVYALMGILKWKK